MATTLGGLNTFFEIIVSAIIGIYLLQNFKFSLQDSIQKARTGQITQDEFIKTNVAKALGAALLIVPGFLTDFIGIALQFGFLTLLLTKIFTFKKVNKNKDNFDQNFNYEHFEKSSFNNTNYKKRSDDEIIDVEIVDDSKSIKH